VSNGTRRSYSASGIVADDQSYESYSNNIDLSGLLSVGYNIGNNTFEWNNVLSRSTESFVERSVGREGDEFRSIYQHTNQWEERQFISSQLLGSHFLNEDGSIFGEWQFTASQARRYVPNRTDVRFNAEANLTEPAVLREGYDFSRPNDEQADLLNGFFISSGSTSKRWDDLIDNNFDGSFDITWDLFDDGASYSQLRFGAQADLPRAGCGQRDLRLLQQWRERHAQRLTERAGGRQYLSSVAKVREQCPARTITLVASRTVPTNGFLFQVRTQVSDEYEAELDYNSVYAMYDHTFDSKYQVVFGARYEAYDQVTDTFDLTTGNPVQGIVDEGSFLPALGFNWFYSDTQQLRLAYHRPLHDRTSRKRQTPSSSTTNSTSAFAVTPICRSPTSSTPTCAGSGTSARTKATTCPPRCSTRI
jgi:hypothetical protein